VQDTAIITLSRTQQEIEERHATIAFKLKLAKINTKKSIAKYNQKHVCLITNIKYPKEMHIDISRAIIRLYSNTLSDTWSSFIVLKSIKHRLLYQNLNG
jgi:hypothetical protein